MYAYREKERKNSVKYENSKYGSRHSYNTLLDNNPDIFSFQKLLDEYDRREQTTGQVGGINNCQEAEITGSQQNLDTGERSTDNNGKTVRGHSMTKQPEKDKYNDESDGKKEDQQKKSTNYENAWEQDGTGR